ncbi:HD-GYP domain-containing protein [Kozakia baliensis]|nr:HD domain-containing phosphohydrolase [Kozakia baliensis]GBR28338.1 metal dependent phosphohydrolase [Kozakia baliensis NRIC 0488]GEL63711.1 phosphohydrolase [Kozakia baliensis]
MSDEPPPGMVLLTGFLTIPDHKGSAYDDFRAQIRKIMRTLRPWCKSDVPILLALDSPSAHDRAWAQSVGVNKVLNSAEPLEKIVLECTTTWQQAANSRVYQAADHVNVTMSNLMRNIRAGGLPNRQKTQIAGRIIDETIKSEGIWRWIKVLSSAQELSHRHSMVLAGLAVAFLNCVEPDDKEDGLMAEACLLHDIGKALVPLSVLNKAGPLTEEEFQIMQKHSEMGHDLMLQQGEYEDILLDIARHHHERFDGKGYPDGLLGDQISQEVRVATLCDIFAALIEPRAYKMPMPPKEALAMMKRMHMRIDMSLLVIFEHWLMKIFGDFEQMALNVL